LLLLNTVGAKTGEPRTKPLAYLADGNRYVIYASFAGSPTHPPWYYNVLANPEVEVELGSEKFKARASVLDEPERTTWYDKIVAALPVFGDYREQAGRTIPVIALERI
jgi:deazaflavin-dependent oxidoreductase (nitroreductase family)